MAKQTISKIYGNLMANFWTIEPPKTEMRYLLALQFT